MATRDLPAEWAHLREWWGLHGHRYNLTSLATATGKSKAAISSLLRTTENRRYKESADLLDRLRTELARYYAFPAPTSL